MTAVAEHGALDVEKMSNPFETIQNPLTKEEVTFIQTVGEADEKKTVVEIRLGPRGKGPPLHYHTAFTEVFEVLEGELAMRVGAETLRLKAGQRATVAINQCHTFWSEMDEPITFRGTIEPSNIALENCFRISFGLARDGHCNSRGIPSKLSHLAVLTTMSQSHLKGVLSVVIWLLARLARLQKCRAIQRDLVRKYCPSTPAGIE